MRKHILAVDDNRGIRRMLEKRLQREGYDVQVAGSGKEALQILKKSPVDLILLDQQMPGMDGIETYAAIREQCIPCPPAIMLTAHGSTNLAVSFMRLGGTDFLEKPIDFDVLELKMQRALQAAEKIQEEIRLRKAAETALKKANRELEQRVAERTEELRQSQEQLRTLAAHLQSTREAERGGIAREIHDDLAQVFYVLKLHLGIIRTKLSDSPDDPAVWTEINDDLNDMMSIIDQTMPKIYQIIEALSPEVMGFLGLLQMLEWHAERFKHRTGIDFSFKSRLKSIALHEDISIVIFRIFQEALLNIEQHSRASRLEVSISRRAGHLILTIADDGVRIRAGQNNEPAALGILAIMERARMVGGDVQVKPNRNQGTMLRVKIPLEAAG